MIRSFFLCLVHLIQKIIETIVQEIAETPQNN